MLHPSTATWPSHTGPPARRLRDNELSGSLPPMRLPDSLGTLDLGRNRLSGSLPRGWKLPQVGSSACLHPLLACLPSGQVLRQSRALFTRTACDAQQDARLPAPASRRASAPSTSTASAPPA